MIANTPIEAAIYATLIIAAVIGFVYTVIAALNDEEWADYAIVVIIPIVGLAGIAWVLHMLYRALLGPQ